MAHTSDHLRRVTPDGLEDLTYAAAFEIGRLLALSQPSVVAAQMRWRADQYGASRISSLTAGAFSGVLDAPPGTAPRDLGRLLGGAFLAAAATAPRQVIGPRRPVADPGRPIPGLAAATLDQAVAAGLGLDLAALRKTAQALGPAAALAEQSVPAGSLPAGPVLEGPALDTLRLAAEAQVGRTASAAVDGSGPVPGATPDRAPDALDILLRRMGDAAADEGSGS
jgi:hypothetical protein